MPLSSVIAHQVDPEIRTIAQWLRHKRTDRFLVASHIHPDGDGLAAMLACARILRTLGKQVWAVADGFLSPRYAFLPDVATVVPYREGLEAELPVANVITVDVPTVPRLERVARLLSRDATILKIDHHPSDDHFGHFNYVDIEASSTTELVYLLCGALRIPLDPEIATLLYTGIAFDTGRFRFSSTSARALTIAGDLVQAGANPQHIAEQLFYEYRPTTLSLLAHTLRSIERFYDGRVAVASLDYSLLGQVQYRDEDVDGFVDYAVSMRGVQVALFLREHEPGHTRVSLRAKHDFDVRAVAEIFGGGGHRKAAGARFASPLQEVKTTLLAEIQRRLNGTG